MGSWQVGERQCEESEGLPSDPSAPPARAAEVPACLAATQRCPLPSPSSGLEPAWASSRFPLHQPPLTQDTGAQIDSIPHSTASFTLTAQSSHHLIARLWMNVPETDEMHHCLPCTHKCHGNSNSTTTAKSQTGIRQPREPTICEAKPSTWCLF